MTSRRILATLRLVALTLNAETGFALVCLIIREIHISVVNQNAFLTWNAPRTRFVLETNA